MPGPASRARPRRSSHAEGRRRTVNPSVRQQLPFFAAVGALCILMGLIPFPHGHTAEVVVAGVIFLALTVGALVLPWSRLPTWTWTLIPLGSLTVIALVRDAQGGSASGLATLYLIPIVWLAFYGKRSHVAIGLVVMLVALVMPILVEGPPAYPDSGWRGVVILVCIGALISFTLVSMVGRERGYVDDMARQADLVRLGARQAEQAREQLASLLRAATQTAVVGSNPEGLVTFFSAGAERLFGWPAVDVVGKMTVFQFIDPGELRRHHPRIENLAFSGEESTWTFVRRDGSAGRMSMTVTAQLPPSESMRPAPAGYVVVATDVTEREQMGAERERLLSVQREVTQALVEQNHRLRELTQMKDDVVATVSHELRTPLTSIRGFVELLLDGSGAPLDDEQVHMLRAIDRSSDQLLRVSDDLLADPELGRGLRLQFVDTDLALLAGEAVDAMASAAAERGIELTLSAPAPVLVHGDPFRLHQLLGNLLSNAVKYTPPGGRASVRVKALGPLARLDVLDDGPGVPPEERTQLFDRFYRLASTAEQGVPGSGLGLAIARSVAEAHNGTIEIVDTAGWSTTFRVHLPAVDQAGEPLATGSPMNGVSSNGGSGNGTPASGAANGAANGAASGAGNGEAKDVAEDGPSTGEPIAAFTPRRGAPTRSEQ
ncbi:MAG TPA: ATP-binding protein [Acidimicrobiales bacterium]|nr:ATP-binding protein [Acidimicrobiales bacterium]